MWIIFGELYTERMWIMWISRKSNRDFVQFARLTITIFLCYPQKAPLFGKKGSRLTRKGKKNRNVEKMASGKVGKKKRKGGNTIKA